MSKIHQEFTYTVTPSENWFYQKYYTCGANGRYFTFQAALNLLSQRKENPLIIETGCQRQENDLGAGMSTSIFGEWCFKYGGSLITVDNCREHLTICKDCTKEWGSVISYIEMDSLRYLLNLSASPDLVYLDSLDFPIGDDAGNIKMRDDAQNHNLKEFLALEKSGRLLPSTIVLLDDNQLPYGGKPALLKKYLEMKGWTCLLDFQQSLWIKEE
jgi:hypothetical protein